MLFRTNTNFSRFKKAEHSSIISSTDVELMLKNEYLRDKKAIFHVDNDQSSKPLTSELLDISQTIIIKELEFWNKKVSTLASQFSSSTNVHLYYSPPFATAFDWHADDRDVYIVLQKGEKLFEVEEPDQSISRYLLTEGSELFIPYGAKHRAHTTDVLSIHLSFGIWPKDLFIESDYRTIS